MEVKLLLVVVVGFAFSLSACVTSTQMNLNSKRDGLMLEGHTKEYIDSYMDGCVAGYRDFVINDSLEYQDAWQLGYDACREEFLSNVQQENYKRRSKTNHKTSRDYDFDERQQLIWEELSK